MRRPGRMATGTAVFSACVLAGGVAWAAIPGGDGTIDGCYLKVTGTLRVIDTGKGDKCIKGLETPISWNQKGDPGPAGAKGATGAAGAKGDAGPAGAKGATGAAGPKGDTGPKGDSGAAGPAGKDGAPGPQGDTGPAGKDGAPGAQGDTGPQGPSGAQGATGPQGPAGSGGSGALWALVRSDGNKTNGSVGVTVTRVKNGVYVVTFPSAVGNCGMNISATQYAGNGLVGTNPNLVDPANASHFFFSVYNDLVAANSVVVGEYDTTNSTLTDGPFTIAALCS
jgi:hypothetical protein